MATPPFDDFQALSRRYWQAWADGLRGAGAASFGSGMQNPWRSAMDAWVDSGIVSRHDMDAALGQFTRLSGDWMAQMQDLAGQFAGRNASASEIVEAWRSMLAGAGSNVFPNLVQQMPGADWWQGSGEAMLKAMQARPSALLDLPAFGLTREHTERAQALGQAQVELQERLVAWQAMLQQSIQDALKRFEKKLSEHAAPGKQITSVRGLFDVWVDAAEEAYADMALSREYRTVYAALANAQMRLRAAGQAIAEHAANLAGMPTRTELDAAHRKLAEVERQLRRLGEGAVREPARPRRSEAPAATTPAPAAPARKAGRTRARPGKATTATSSRPAAAGSGKPKPAARKAARATKAAKASKTTRTGTPARKPARGALPDIRTPGVKLQPSPGRKGSKRT